MAASARRPNDEPPITASPWLRYGGAGTGLLGLWLAGRAWWRRRPRRCSSCGSTMRRLGERADDVHLSGAEQTEERLGSVDYDVWACPACDAVTKLRYGAWFSRYARCPQCRARTRSTRRTTLQEATYTSGGLVQIDEQCANCAFQRSYTRSTPQLTRSSSGGSSGFGGGHSSGGGASGRW